MKNDYSSVCPVPDNSCRKELCQKELCQALGHLQHGRRLKRALFFSGWILLFCLAFAGGAVGATYYIDYSSGSDSNSGTSASAPWKRHPFMAGWSGAYIHSPGDTFIFKGGVTWPANCFPLTVPTTGNSTKSDTYGADYSWYSGSSWTKPVMDGAYSAGTLFDLSNIPGYITISDLELKRVRCTNNFGPGLITGGPSTNVLIKNCYLHGWTVTTSTDDAHGGIVFTNFNSGAPTIVIDSCEIENSENRAAWNGVCCRMVGVIRNSKIHDNSSAVLFCLDFDHSQLYNICTPNSGFDGTYHFNGIYLDGSTMGQKTAYIRNSFLHDVGGGANMAYPNPRDQTQYIYNNVMYGSISDQQAIEIDPYNYGSGGATGACYVYNNTIVVPPNNYTAIHVVNRGGNPKLNILVAQNNQVIGTNAVVQDGEAATVAQLTATNNVLQTPAVASSQGYTLSSLYAPMNASGSSINAGTSAPSNIFTTDVRGVQRPQGGAWDIGAYEYSSTSPLAPAAPTGLRIAGP